MVSSTPRPHFTPGKTRYPLYRRLGGTQGRSRRAENLVPTGSRSPDRPARSQSLYRLSYRAHSQLVELDNNGSAEGSISETKDMPVLRLAQDADGYTVTTD